MMTIRAGGRVALIAAFALLAGASWTAATSSAAEVNSENASTSGETNRARHDKRYVHRKSDRTVQRSSEEEKANRNEATKAILPSELPAPVANANARMEGGEIADDAARAMTARANAPLDKGQGTALIQVAEADQLNEIDKAIQEPAPPPQTTVAVAPSRPAAIPKFSVDEISTWNQTSLIGKIFLAFGALLTIASAARMFMA